MITYAHYVHPLLSARIGPPVTTEAPRSAPTLGFLLADVLRSARRDFSRRATDIRLTPALARLLYYVHLEPGCHQATLAQWLEVTPVTLGRMVDRLVQRGYVRRVEDARDRRAFRVYLDDAGAPVLDKVDQIRAQTEERALLGLSASERDTLMQLLGQLRNNLADPGA